jgi:hypothetical protein
VVVRGAAFYDSVLVMAPAYWSPSVAYYTSEDKTREGRYTVEVRKPGYLDWIKNDVAVESNGCHRGPGPVVKTALQPRA